MECAPKLHGHTENDQHRTRIKIQREPGVPLLLSHLQPEGNGASIILVQLDLSGGQTPPTRPRRAPPSLAHPSSATTALRTVR